MREGSETQEEQLESASVGAAGSTPINPDPFDPSRLRLSQNFGEELGVKKALLTVPVRKPGRQEWVWTHPDPEYRLNAAVLELKEEREVYLLDPTICGELAGELIPKALFTTINRQGVLTLWPVGLPGEDGRHNEWSRSAMEAAEMAQKQWIRVQANMSLGAYEVSTIRAEVEPPEWPEVPFSEILRIAFKGRFIQSLDHTVLRRLRGEV